MRDRSHLEVLRDNRGLDDLEGMPEYQVGLWYSPYVKVYSIGGKNRIAEISNYPRAYKDTNPHVYTKNVTFTVTEDDINHEENGERFYRDSKASLFKVGEEATHWMGDSLPRAFPLWIESDTLPFTADSEKHVFSLDKVPAPIRDLKEVSFKVNDVYVKQSKTTLKRIAKKLALKNIVFPRQPEDGDRQIIRIKYKRIF